MKNKIYYVFGFIFVFCFALIMSSCSSDTNQYENYATVIYHLEGGTYAGSKEDVKIYYNVKEGEELSIGKTLENLDNRTIEADGMGKKLAGWYKTKSEDGTYSNLVNENEKIGYKEEINLYARWKTATTYSFVIKAKINNEDVELARYEANEGEEFKLDSSRKNEIKEALLEHNCTYFKSFTYDNKEISENNVSEIVIADSDSTLDSVDYVIYANYIPGKYQLVSNASELNEAIESGFDAYDGIYLLNDIETTDVLKLYKFTGASYNKTIIFNGNNHTITYSTTTRNINQKTKYDYNGKKDVILCSLFDVLDKVQIKDLNINCTMKVNSDNAILAGFATKVTNSTLSNVNVTFSYSGSDRYLKALIAYEDLTNYNGIFDTDQSSNNVENYIFTISKN